MSCSVIIEPSPRFINIYYYYSNFTLFLSLLITPLLFYLILTKSKNLKSFKWLILNHTFWCFFFEVFFASVKPVFLAPTLCGYALGLFKNGNLKISTFIIFFIIVLMVFLTTSLALTLMNRYLAAIPSSEVNRWLLKSASLFALFASTTCFVADAASFYPIFMKDKNETISEATKFDPCLAKYFSAEPSFIFISHEYMKTYLHILFILFIVLIILGISLGIYFIYMIRSKNNSQTLAKLQRSLTLSVTIQLLITVAFLLIPTAIFTAILAFQIPNSENFVFVIFCFFVSHSVLESFVTMYFVTPYRKGIAEILKSSLSFIFKPRSNIVSAVEPLS